MLRRLLIATLCFCCLAALAQAEEPPIDLDAVLSRWTDAVADWRSVDAEIERFEYDHNFRTVAHSRGRFYQEASGAAALVLKPTPRTEKPCRIEGRNYGYTTTASQHVIWNRAHVTIIDHEAKQYGSLDRDECEEHFRLLCAALGSSNWLKRWQALRSVVGVHTRPEVSLPFLAVASPAVLEKQFEMRLTSSRPEVVLAAKPRPEGIYGDDTISVLIDPVTGRPYATRWISNGGHYETVNVFKSVRWNEPPEDRASLFSPDLSGLKNLNKSAENAQ